MGDLETGPVTAEEAHEILGRFIASHFREKKIGEQARFSIPVNPMRDDDVRMSAFIDQSQARITELEAEVEKLKSPEVVLDSAQKMLESMRAVGVSLVEPGGDHYENYYWNEGPSNVAITQWDGEGDPVEDLRFVSLAEAYDALKRGG